VGAGVSGSTPPVRPRPAPTVRAIVTARDEEGRVGPTVAGLFQIAELASVIVLDDGSSDRTAAEASRAGAVVLRGPPRGKGAALEAALDRLDADVYLLADGDLGSSSSELRPLVLAVLEGDVELAVGVPPAPLTGGFGLVKGLAMRLVDRTAGTRPDAPLSGQRAMRRECLWACRPLAAGFGLESAMIADALRLGFRVAELPVDVGHRFTSKDLAGFLHRGRQGLDVVRALGPRLAGIR
jgi:glycosyltransferase involved in cell wall biosynthesis